MKLIPEFYVTEEIAQMFRVNSITVRRWAKQNKIKALRKGKRWYFPKEEVEKYIWDRQAK